MNILFVTLARGGSKSVPKKNIKEICGRPLIDYTIEAVFKSQYYNGKNYFISTDSHEIANVCARQGVQLEANRPDCFSSDAAPSGAALKHATYAAERINGKRYELVVEVMVTNPFKTVDDIDGCIDLLLRDNRFSSVVAVRRVFDEHPSRIKYLDDDGRLMSFWPEVLESRRQDLSPPAFIRAGSVYAVRRTLIDRELRYDNEHTGAYVIPESRVLNIDEAIDFSVAEVLMQKKGYADE